MPTLSAYLFFDGNCAEAMRFYQRALGGNLDIKTHADTMPPDQIAPGMADRVMHARLDFAGNTLMASDGEVGKPVGGMKACSLSLTYDEAADTRRVFAALAEGGRVTLPVEKTFWSEAFGMLVDQFGTPWMVNTVQDA